MLALIEAQNALIADNEALRRGYEIEQENNNEVTEEGSETTN